MANSNTARGTHRLLDMVVEEVSLVDHAANQRTFLIVKRSDAMATDETTEGTDEDDEVDADGADADEDAAEDDETDSKHDQVTPPAGTGAPAGTSPPAGSASAADPQALTKLVGVVEDTLMVVEQLSERLAGLEKGIGTSPAPKKPKKPTRPATDEDDEEDVEADADDEERVPPRSRRRPPTKTAKDVRSRLAGLPGATTKAGKGDTGILAKLDQIHSAVTEVKRDVAEQKSRVGRLEKQTGLPSSLPPDGKKKTTPDAVTWPLDINRPNS